MLAHIMETRIDNLVSSERLVEFCRRWRVAELPLFGSALRDDFRPDSDVDLLVTFTPDADWRYWDLLAMQEELTSLLGLKVDLVDRAAVETSENWIRRKHILEHAKLLYVAR